MEVVVSHILGRQARIRVFCLCYFLGRSQAVVRVHLAEIREGDLLPILILFDNHYHQPASILWQYSMYYIEASSSVVPELVHSTEANIHLRKAQETICIITLLEL